MSKAETIKVVIRYVCPCGANEELQACFIANLALDDAAIVEMFRSQLDAVRQEIEAHNVKG